MLQVQLEHELYRICKQINHDQIAKVIYFLQVCIFKIPFNVCILGGLTLVRLITKGHLEDNIFDPKKSFGINIL